MTIADQIKRAEKNTAIIREWSPEGHPYLAALNMHKEIVRLRKIIAELYKDWPEPRIENMDGFDAQEFGEKHGILVHVERTVPCNRECACAEVIPEGEPSDCYYLSKEFFDRAD